MGKANNNESTWKKAQEEMKRIENVLKQMKKDTKSQEELTHELMDSIGSLITDYIKRLFAQIGKPITQEQAENLLANLGMAIQIKRLKK